VFNSIWFTSSERKEGVRYKVEHETRYSISTSAHVLFCLLYKHTDNQGRSQNFSKGESHCQIEGTNLIVLSFLQPVGGCLLKKGLQKGGSRASQDSPPLATPLLITFLTIFRRFPAALPKIVRRSHERYILNNYFPKISKDFEENRYSEHILPVPWPFVKSRFHCISEVINIFTSEDMENTPPESQMWLRMNFTSGVFSSETLVFI